MPSELEIKNSERVLEMLSKMEDVSFEQKREDIFEVTEPESGLMLTSADGPRLERGVTFIRTPWSDICPRISIMRANVPIRGSATASSSARALLFIAGHSPSRLR